ncbi:zinc metallopeptidase [Luteolibacter flavescens]|uniref:Zinc metallopeptidase n=1 Tax=Luteolibacter flavescens TaxID=1859460 RepID=A0ABT3FNC7_9BACT|nr:zinc metallopeptidase [Luteolibacter flavescens]MCW1884751.1 zinc metallopeptidase [Luteolibacter flavescens]
MISESLLLLAQQQPGGIGIGYWVIIGVSMLASLAISGMLKKRFNEYSQIPLRMTGAQVAEAMLRQNGITDVQVIHTPGHLTDHYDPMRKTVNLSESVYQMNSVAAAAVAAHEVGHAIQHQQAYAWLNFRSKMVPAVQFASTIQQYLMFGAMIGAGFFHSPTMLWIWVVVFGITTLFAVITLPVEFDASKRAMVWLERSGIANQMEHDRAKNALFWAAMTYVAGAVGAIAQLLYWVMMLMGRRDE